mgnify:CR=1 FL=1|tara:strand:- start:728 stop:931 length:204 start_codon:yes stop_codon:yes gene_type:complete
MDKKKRREVVQLFLERCVIYANASIERKIKRGDEESEINKWIAYRDFTEHAIMEIESGDLDAWLEED